MDTQTLQSFFMWCTIINVGLFAYVAILSMFAPDWICRVQSKFFPLSKDAFTVAIYSFLGLFKIFILMFNLVPYLALVIMG